ncbi:cdc21-like protein [Chaetoceros tenuissimus]|uniref:DNA helicase n=1 Tax=Chaetoceros tenuissimus TaxID=426638 RepID=A0AAD3CZ08_9STRA|nr:cdc21-like protein [Chaetoceros tenuissimus]
MADSSDDEMMLDNTLQQEDTGGDLNNDEEQEPSVPPTPSTPQRLSASTNNDDNDTSSIPATPMTNTSRRSSGNVDNNSVIPSTPAARFQLAESSDEEDNMNQNEDNEVVPSTPANHPLSNLTDNVSVSTPMTGFGSLGGSVLNVSPSRAVGDYGSDLDSRLEDSNQNQGRENRAATAAMRENDEDDMELEQNFIRGTNIVVATAAAAFKEFLQNFISVEESERAYEKEQKKKRRERRQASGADGGGSDPDDDSDDDSFESLDSVDSNEEKSFIYLDKIRDILFQRNSKSTSAGDGDAMTSSTENTDGAVAFDLDSSHLFFHSPACQRLYHQLISYPAEVIPLMDLIVGREMESIYAELLEEMEESSDEDAYATLHPQDVPLPKVQVRPFHLKSLAHMRSLDPHSMDNLLSIRGMVVRTSPIIPDLKVAHFQCTICAHTEAITLERGRISEPTVCPECNIKQGFELVHNRCIFADKQMVRIQETPNEVPAGETPASIVLFAYDDLVDAVRPGDRIEVTGVFRAQPRRVNPKISRVKSVYRTYVDVVHFRRVSGDKGHGASNNLSSKKKGGEEDNEVNRGKGMVESVGGKLSPQRIEELLTLSKSPDIYQKLVQSLAPSIWELDDVKKGVLCMLFGGNSRRVKKGTADKKRKQDEESDFEDEDDENYDEESASTKLNKRGDINILLCGDPGTSKSQLLSYVHKLSPRGVYTSGKGSSAVGLTASIVRDPETRELVLESGALVLSDLGICCIDEFDKMSDTTRAILHEAMEQQTVSIAKAGIIATLNARTSILASANPVESRYNPNMSVVENIKLPPTLLSRFDLIYLILDAPNTESDRKLAQHLVGLYYETPNVVQPPLDQPLLRDYIAYARECVHPELSDLATRELINAYLDMRKEGYKNSGNSGTKTISATPRQLESLVRLSEAIAKMRLGEEVIRADVKEAVRLMKVATQAAATDPRTGRIDMDMISTGRSAAMKEVEQMLNINVRELLNERKGKRMAIADITRQIKEVLMNQEFGVDDVLEALRSAENDGLIQLNERAQTVFVRQGAPTN